MADLQVVFLRDMLKVVKVEPKLDSTFPALNITGTRFQAAVAVLINGIEAPNFVAFGQTQIVAEIPESIDVVSSVAVLSGTLVSTERSVLLMRLGGQAVKVKGILRLVQRFILMLLSSPGSDLYNPGKGGGLQKLIGRTIYRDSNAIHSDIQQAVDKAAKDLRDTQTRSTWLTPDERIVSARLLGVEYDSRTTTLAVRIQLDSEAGQTAVANLFA